MQMIPFMIVGALIATVGLIWLQFFLSKRSNKWTGLILPILSFASSLLNVLNIKDTGDLWQNITLIVSTVFLSNIPTIIFLSTYLACRENLKRKVQLKNLNIQDSE